MEGGGGDEQRPSGRGEKEKPPRGKKTEVERLKEAAAWGDWKEGTKKEERKEKMKRTGK